MSAPSADDKLQTAAGDQLRTAAERLVDELRDECSEVGVSARGLNLAGLEAGVRAFAREAKRYGAMAERMLVLLKECLRDERLPQHDRAQFDQLMSSIVKWSIDEYYGNT